MLYRIRWSLAVSLTVLAAACTESEAPVGLEDDPLQAAVARASEAQRWQGPLESVARAIAVAVNGDAAARRAIRDILRDSPWSGHRVTLEELIAADGGDAIVTAAARALGESADAFRARVGTLPTMDFLIPSREHQRTWRATPGVLVVATLDPENGPYAIFGSDGRTGSTESVHKNQVVLLIQPAEPRLPRINPQPVGVGAVIQSEEDGGYGFQRIATTSLDETIAVQPISGDLSPQSHLGTDKTYLDRIFTHFCDGGGEATGEFVELKLEVRFEEAGGRERYDEYRLDIACLETYHPHEVLIAEVLPDSSGHYLTIEVWELDSGLNGDDDYKGTRNFYWSDRAESRSLPQGGPYTTDLELDWTRRAASVLTSAWVPSVSVWEGGSELVTAQARDQYGYSLSGYSVSSWWTGNPSVASVSSAGGMKATVTGNQIGSTSLHATVSGITDAASVEVQSTGCPPPQVIC